MNNIVFIENGIVIEVNVTDEALEYKKIEQIALESTDVPINDILINVVTPKEPNETWYIEDGEIKIDQQKLIEFNRKNMPDLSRIEFKYKLHKAGKLEEVEQFIQTTDNFLLQLAYNEAQFFSRTDPLLSQALVDLGWTEAQVDEIWTS